MTFSLSSILSVVSLLVSLAVAWLTLFRRGTLHMTQPVQIAFVFENGKPKIFLRTLLYATGKRGYVIEGLYLKVQHAGSTHTFGFWGYGERNELMVAGGLRVTEDGIAYNHHFLQNNEHSEFSFQDGKYGIEVYARIVNRDSAKRLAKVKVALSTEDAAHLEAHLRLSHHTGVLFTWEPDTGTYHPSLNPPPRGESQRHAV